MSGSKQEQSWGLMEGQSPPGTETGHGKTAPCGPVTGEDARYRLLVEDLPVIVMELLPDGAIRYANAAASDFFGFSAPPATGGAPEVSFCVRHLEAICDRFLSVTREAPETSLTSRVDFRGGSHWIEWNLKAQFDGGNKPARFLVTGFDITQKKCNEDRLLKSREVALAANKARSGFMANMSHEIRTPLNGVMGMLQLLQTSGLKPEQKEFADTALHSCERLTNLLSDILDLSRAESHKLALTTKPFSLKELVTDVCSLFDLTARQANLRLSCSIDDSIPDSLLGDRLRIQQVLNNLVGNALKFTNAGEVRIEVFRQLPCGYEPFRILFMVTDTGIGVSEEKIASLFTPFTQISTGFSRRFEGAGLGLSISKRLVELMDGNIAIASEENQGTTVAVSLPLEPGEKDRPEARQARPEHLSPATGLRVLIAEDDYVNSYSARVMLEWSGYRVDTAENGVEALRLLGEHTFDVVLMDIQMPGMDGLATTEAIRRGDAGEQNVSIPIVAMTSYAMAGDRERFLDSGMDGYLAKPVAKKALLSAVAKAVAPMDEDRGHPPAAPGDKRPPGEDGQRPAPRHENAPSTRFASALRSPHAEIESDFHDISQNSCSIYFDFFPLPLLVLNGNRQIVFSNQACLRLLGLSSVQDFLGRRPGEAMHCAYSGLEPGGCGTSRFCRECGFVRALLACMENDTPSTHDSLILQSVEGRCRAKDLRVHAAPFDIGLVRYYVVTIRDISDVKQRELMERIFFHDVMNTIGGARNLVELLRIDDGEDLRETRELLGTALNSLVDEIRSHRDLLLAEKGEYPLNETKIMSGNIIGDVAEELLTHPAAEGKDIAISKDCGNRLVWADRTLLRRVLINMLKNGLEGTHPGGTVRIGCLGDQGHVVFEVQNDQVMDRKTQLQVFKRFFSTKGPGRGMGTYSIKLLTEDYLRGSVDFVSNERVGTIFRIALPELVR